VPTSIILKNLTLTDGDVSGGGAIRAVGVVSLTLAHVTVRDSAAVFGKGGGLFFETPQTTDLPAGTITPRLEIRDSFFQNNLAIEGGGAFINLGGRVSDGSHVQSLGQHVLITGSQFLGNTAQNRGGGVSAWQGAGGEVEIVESRISGNVAGTQRNNGIVSYELRDAGGGVYSYLFSGDEQPNGTVVDGDGTDNGIAKLVISGSTIDSNISGTFGGGVAICAKREDVTPAVRSQTAFVNTTISGNIVLRNGTEPGGNGHLGHGGGVALAIYPNDDNEGLDSHFENATVTKNRGLDGGGIWSMVPSLADGLNRTWLTNTIVSDNTKIDVTIPNNLSGSF
jgi:hypothetical protein